MAHVSAWARRLTRARPPPGRGPLGEAPWELRAGRAALVPFGLAVITSEWRKTLPPEYGLWRYTHVAFATLGFAAAVGHIVGIGNFTAATLPRALWPGAATDGA